VPGVRSREPAGDDVTAMRLLPDRRRTDRSKLRSRRGQSHQRAASRSSQRLSFRRWFIARFGLLRCHFRSFVFGVRAHPHTLQRRLRFRIKLTIDVRRPFFDVVNYTTWLSISSPPPPPPINIVSIINANIIIALLVCSRANWFSTTPRQENSVASRVDIYARIRRLINYHRWNNSDINKRYSLMQ